jgi:hypothetical protein
LAARQNTTDVGVMTSRRGEEDDFASLGEARADDGNIGEVGAALRQAFG